MGCDECKRDGVIRGRQSVFILAGGSREIDDAVEFGLLGDYLVLVDTVYCVEIPHESMKPALEGSHENAVDKEDQLGEMGATCELCTCRMEGEGLVALRLTRDRSIVETESYGPILRIERRVHQRLWGICWRTWIMRQNRRRKERRRSPR